MKTLKEEIAIVLEYVESQPYRNGMNAPMVAVAQDICKRIRSAIKSHDLLVQESPVIVIENGEYPTTTLELYYDGFVYMGEKIEDAGRAHKLYCEFMEKANSENDSPAS